MKRLVVLALALLLAFPMIAWGGNVRGHWRDSDRDGLKDQYVQPYHRTNPDGIRSNNYSYPGNTNPWTGKTTPGNPYGFDSQPNGQGRGPRY